MGVCIKPPKNQESLKVLSTFNDLKETEGDIRKTRSRFSVSTSFLKEENFGSPMILHTGKKRKKSHEKSPILTQLRRRSFGKKIQDLNFNNLSVVF